MATLLRVAAALDELGSGLTLDARNVNSVAVLGSGLVANMEVDMFFSAKLRNLALGVAAAVAMMGTAPLPAEQPAAVPMACPVAKTTAEAPSGIPCTACATCLTYQCYEQCMRTCALL